jgi:hypothetical protein
MADTLTFARNLISHLLAPSPRSDNFLACDCTSECPGKNPASLGLLRAYNAGNEFLDPRTTDWPDGTKRPIHEEAARAFARRLVAFGYSIVSLDTEGWWGSPRFVRDTVQIIKWIKSERPQLIVLSYGQPPGDDWNPWDTPEERTAKIAKDVPLAPLISAVDGINISLYNSDDSGRAALFAQYAPTRIQQARTFGKPVYAETSHHAFNADPNTLLPLRDPKPWKAELELVKPLVDGILFWGDGSRLYHNPDLCNVVKDVVK